MATFTLKTAEDAKQNVKEFQSRPFMKSLSSFNDQNQNRIQTRSKKQCPFSILHTVILLMFIVRVMYLEEGVAAA